MRPTSQARTNHLGNDAGSSRKIPDGALALACSAPTESLAAGKPNALTWFVLTLFRFLCFGFGTVKAAFKATTATITMRPVDSGGSSFQIQVKVDGATVMLDAGSAWTAADVKAALHTKTGRASGGYYLVAGGGKPLNDGAATTLAALGVGPGDQLELRGRLRGGMPSQADLRAAFALYDTNGDGQLSPDELKAIMCKQVPGGTARTEAEVDELVRQFDADGDGVLSMEEISKAWAEEYTHVLTSYWDEASTNRPPGPNASALKRALADTVLVDAAWLAQLADAGGVLPRCQDLPEGARVTLEEMEKWTDSFTVGVLVISYPWLDADHPDKDGLQLRAISHVLKMFDKEAKEAYGDGLDGETVCKVGVFFDYVSMPQRSRGSAEDDRTPEEKATFDRSLKAINLWYGHPKTHVLLVDTDLPAGEKTNTQPYEGRGWCQMEFNASGLVKDDSALISLKGLTGKEDCLYAVRENGKAARKPPVAPAPFSSTLEAGVASGSTKFTNSGDVGLVGKIYGWAFAAEMEAAVSLSYLCLEWDGAQMLTLCEALRAAHAGGGLRKLEKLNLGFNKMGDVAMAALVALLEEGAMPNLKELEICRNKISDAGIAALTSALLGGALPSCTYITLGRNPGDDAPVREALASPERAAALALRQAE